MSKKISEVHTESFIAVVIGIVTVVVVAVLCTANKRTNKQTNKKMSPRLNYRKNKYTSLIVIFNKFIRMKKKKINKLKQQLWPV